VYAAKDEDKNVTKRNQAVADASMLALPVNIQSSLNGEDGHSIALGLVLACRA
jgi:hypothetical protein